MNISPIVSIVLNALATAASGVAATQVPTASGGQALWVVAGLAFVNGLLHAFSSAMPGPLASSPPAAK